MGTKRNIEPVSKVIYLFMAKTDVMIMTTIKEMIYLKKSGVYLNISVIRRIKSNIPGKHVRKNKLILSHWMWNIIYHSSKFSIPWMLIWWKRR